MMKLMNNMIAVLTATAADKDGVTALEYGVIAATTIVVGLAAFNLIGPTLAGVFTTVNGALAG